MRDVRAKKHLGQHFLNDENIAKNIVDSLTMHMGYKNVLEVGPGMGVLTKYLLQNQQYDTKVIEVDTESIIFLKKNYPQLDEKIFSADFLRLDLSKYYTEPFAVIGNFPYNISSQILFKVLDYKDQIPEVVGMFQKEVAERIASVPGKKAYGILSVFMQAFYDIEYLFTVGPEVFTPPPKVQSAVIRLKRNTTAKLACDEKLFIQVVKAAFNQRRKTLRNALSQFKFSAEDAALPIFTLRAERLSVADFIGLTNKIIRAEVP